MKIYFFFFLMLLFASCADLLRPKQLQRIDEIQSNLIEAKEQLNEIKVDSLEHVLTDMETVDFRIKEYYSGDTISVEFASKLAEYRILIPALKNILRSLNQVDSAIIVRENQLNILKNEIQKSAGNRAKYDENILFEAEEVNAIYDFVKFCDSTASSSLDTFNILQPQIEQFSIQCEDDYKIQQEQQ